MLNIVPVAAYVFDHLTTTQGRPNIHFTEDQRQRMEMSLATLRATLGQIGLKPNMIDLSDEVRQSLIAWAERTNAVSELWLFGSRAKGTSRGESDVDLAVSLMPQGKEKYDWAFGEYVALADTKWRPELIQIVGRSISFGAVTSNDEMDYEVRSTGIMLWKRGSSTSDHDAL